MFRGILLIDSERSKSCHIIFCTALYSLLKYVYFFLDDSHRCNFGSLFCLHSYRNLTECGKSPLVKEDCHLQITEQKDLFLRERHPFNT